MMNHILHIIVNEGARTGKTASIWRRVSEVLQKRGIAYELYRTEREGHATEYAGRLSALDESAVYLIVLGGDGTINEVLNGITDFEKVRLGVIPTGSGNDFGRGFWISKNPLEALEQILCCIAREDEGTLVPRVDLGQVSWGQDAHRRIFGISSGVGLDAFAAKQALHSRLKTFLNKLRLGNLVYVVYTIRALFTMETADCIITYDGDARMQMERLIFAAAMNLTAEGGGVPMAPRAVPTDGLLSLSSASNIPKWFTFFCLIVLLAAKHEHIRGFSVVDSGSFTLHIDRPMVLHADGEYLDDVTDVSFLCLAKKLQLLR